MDSSSEQRVRSDEKPSDVEDPVYREQLIRRVLLKLDIRLV